MAGLLRRMTAEAVGTFALVYVGCAAVVVDRFPAGGYGIIGIALAHAIVLSVMVTATMNISGGHLNPAVTLGLLTAKKVDPKTALSYIVAQLVAAILAVLLLKATLPTSVGRILEWGAPMIHTSITLQAAVLLEAVLTFLLVSAVFGTAVSPKAPAVGGFGIGLVLLFAIIVGGPISGAALNPARAFGPALVSGHWVAQGVYWVGPILGGVAAGLLWGYWLLPREEEARV